MLPTPAGVTALPGIVIGSTLLLVRALRRRAHSRSTPAPCPWLASPLEIDAFHRLEALYPPSQYLISAHTLLVDVIGRQNLTRLSRDEERFAWRAHCDFVIVDRSTLNIHSVVEVNGGQHDLPQQRGYDALKAAILARMGIPLITWQRPRWGVWSS